MALNKKAFKDAFQGLKALKTLEVDAPGIGKVMLRELSGLALDRFQAKAIDPETREVDISLLAERKARLAQESIIDPDTGKVMFDSEKDFIETISVLPAKALEEIARAAMELNGLAGGNEEAED